MKELQECAEDIRTLWDEAGENEGIDWDTFTPAIERLLEALKRLED